MNRTTIWADPPARNTSPHRRQFLEPLEPRQLLSVADDAAVAAALVPPSSTAHALTNASPPTSQQQPSTAAGEDLNPFSNQQIHPATSEEADDASETEDQATNRTQVAQTTVIPASGSSDGGADGESSTPSAVIDSAPQDAPTASNDPSTSTSPSPAPAASSVFSATPIGVDPESDSETEIGNSTPGISAQLLSEDSRVAQPTDLTVASDAPVFLASARTAHHGARPALADALLDFSAAGIATSMRDSVFSERTIETLTTRLSFDALKSVARTLSSALASHVSETRPASTVPAAPDTSSSSPFSSQRIYHLVRGANPMALLGDSAAVFADECARLEGIMARNVRLKPWIVTAAAVAVDAVILTHYVHRRRRPHRA